MRIWKRNSRGRSVSASNGFWREWWGKWHPRLSQTIMTGSRSRPGGIRKRKYKTARELKEIYSEQNHNAMSQRLLDNDIISLAFHYISPFATSLQILHYLNQKVVAHWRSWWWARGLAMKWMVLPKKGKRHLLPWMWVVNWLHINLKNMLICLCSPVKFKITNDFLTYSDRLREMLFRQIHPWISAKLFSTWYSHQSTHPQGSWTKIIVSYGQNAS